MADSGAQLQPAAVTAPQCPRCWFPAPMIPLAALEFRCARCEWPFTLSAASPPSPAVPASGTAYKNASGSPMTVALSGGTASAASVNGTAQGLAAPASAPSVSASPATGGSLTAGVYQAVVTYVNGAGETLASAAGSATVSGTDELTVPSPAAVSGATGWNGYVTVHGGSTFYLQNSSPVAIGTALTLSANPVTTGAQPPSANTTFGTMTVPVGGTVTLTYAGSAPAWTWALPQTGSSVPAGGTSLPFASGGTAFTLGQMLIVDPSGTPDVVAVNGTPAATSVPVTGLAAAHDSGVPVTVAQAATALSAVENVPQTAY